MARALESAEDCAILKANPRLTAEFDGFSYQIVREGKSSIYTVSNGKETLSVPLDWAFGQGAAGQTYVYQRNGHWYESRASYFSEVKGLDHTMGAQTAAPSSLEEAAGRLMDESDAQACFSCHSTNAIKDHHLDAAHLFPGVLCERCHGPSERHLSAVRSGDVQLAAMRKLGGLTTEEMSDFCGQCHRTWAQIAQSGPRGTLNVRFQPYRLTNSRCYDSEDTRIRCTSCHDPHRDVETKPRSYDSKCLACHSSSASGTAARAHVCRVSKQDCVTCHMPKIDLAGAHNKFTDHLIRIVKANDRYPD